jgi:hypothetical protein
MSAIETPTGILVRTKIFPLAILLWLFKTNVTIDGTTSVLKWGSRLWCPSGATRRAGIVPLPVLEPSGGGQVDGCGGARSDDHGALPIAAPRLHGRLNEGNCAMSADETPTDSEQGPGEDDASSPPPPPPPPPPSSPPPSSPPPSLVPPKRATCHRSRFDDDPLAERRPLGVVLSVPSSPHSTRSGLASCWPTWRRAG